MSLEHLLVPGKISEFVYQEGEGWGISTDFFSFFHITSCRTRCPAHALEPWVLLRAASHGAWDGAGASKGLWPPAMVCSAPSPRNAAHL